MLTVGGLFSGIGGFELGLVRAGFEIIWMVEIDEFCQKVLRKNAPDHWPNAKIYGDIKNVGKENLTPPDVLVGGFPCQPFSDAGDKRGKTDDRYLWPEMLRVIRELKPRWVIGENVSGFISMELENAFSDLETEGYKVEAFVLPAYGVGAPHQRNRVWIVAYPQCENGRRLQCANTSSESLHPTQRQESPPPLNGSGQAMAYPSYANGRQNGTSKAESAKWGELGGSNRRGESRIDWWAVEPPVGRVANGIPHRVDRLRGLGNAVVPQIPEILGRLIVAASQ